LKDAGSENPDEAVDEAVNEAMDEAMDKEEPVGVDELKSMRDELRKDVAKLTKWREAKVGEWEGDPEGKLRVKYPDMQTLEAWMDRQCKKALQKKIPTSGKASEAPEGRGQALEGQTATKRAKRSPWAKGTVLKHWDQGRAYRLKLADGKEVWAPIDSDLFIKADEGAVRA
jgi:hypothetical protein